MPDGGCRYSRLSEVSSLGEDADEEDGAASSDGLNGFSRFGCCPPAPSSVDEDPRSSQWEERRRQLEDSLQVCEDKRTERERRLQELRDFWENKSKVVEAEISLHQEEHTRIQSELQTLIDK